MQANTHVSWLLLDAGVPELFWVRHLLLLPVWYLVDGRSTGEKKHTRTMEEEKLDIDA